MSKKPPWARVAPLTASAIIVGVALAITAIPVLMTAPVNKTDPTAPATTGKPITGKPASARPAAIVTRFSLTDHHGARVTEKSYEGRWKLVFFGFTHCPDVCPTALDGVAQVLEKLGPLNRRLVPLFISVDPERDTPKALATYVDAFDSRIVGLTGTTEEVAQAAKSFKVYYARVPNRDAPDQYTVNHSAFLYLMAPDGRYVSHFRHKDSPDHIAAAIKKELQK